MTFQIDRVEDFWVVRDDLIAGGTKRRALVKWLPQLNAQHFIYAGSVYGAGGWALAEACKELGFDCTLVLSKSPYRPPWIDLVDCNIEWREPEPVQQLYQSLLSRNSDTTCVLPLGYEDDGFKRALTSVMRDITVEPSEIWMPCVSGTLLNAAQSAFPATDFNAVCVAKHHGPTGNAQLYYSGQKYHQSATFLPPYPANIFSDAKLWSFVQQFAKRDALIWNTSA